MRISHAAAFEVIRSINMAYDAQGNNLTLRALQTVLCQDLKRCSHPDSCPKLGGVTLQYCCGRGDWKFKAEWCQEVRTYCNLGRHQSRTASFCRRCLCTTMVGDKHWLDVHDMSWHDPSTTADVLDRSMSASLPLPVSNLEMCSLAFPLTASRALHVRLQMRLRTIPGWHADMEAADTLHNLWLGCARDACGSILMDIVEFDARFHDTSWDAALASLTTVMHDWCTSVGLPRSVIDELSH